MNVPQNSSRSSGARRAWAQPRFLLGAATLTLVGATLASFAQSSGSSKAPVSMPHTSSSSKDKPITLADLPALVARYGEAQRLTGASTSTGGRSTRAIGTGQTGFNLVETDLTPNSPSDEREPVVSPNGDFIAFTSTGADTNNDGKIDSLSQGGFRHIWIMTREGKNQRQVTGFGADAIRNQTHPSWSPDGNQIAYSDEAAPTVNGNPNPNAGGSQLYIVSNVQTNPTSAQITFFGQDANVNKSAPATVESPAWAPSGLSIAFVTNYNGSTSLDSTDQHTLPTKDIFTIAPRGLNESLTRITGDTGDPVGNTTDDTHPAWGIANTNLLFFSSNRDANGLLVDNANTTDVNEASGRRIWRIYADGTGPNPVTNPLQRANGRADDQDDYPAPSLATTRGVTEQLAFQTNTYLDDTDFADGARGRDLNVWSMPITTSNFVSAPEPRTFVGSFDGNRVVGVNTNTLQPSTVVPALPVNGTIGHPEGIEATNTSGTNYVFVSDRDNNQIARFVEGTGANAPGGFATGAQPYAFTPATVPNPTAMKLYGGFIYVTSGYNQAAPNTRGFYRFNQATGAAAGNDATGLFSSGETTGNGGAISNGTEGIDINSTGRYVAVSCLLENKINLYERLTGAYVFNASDNASIVPAGTDGLLRPTGVVWGPDLNDDGFQDLYVCSSDNDSIKVFAGPNPAGATFALVGPTSSDRPGSIIATLVADPSPGNGLGAGSTGLNAPEAIRIEDLAKHDTGDGTEGKDGTFEIYVSSFRTLGVAPGTDTPGTVGGGYQVNRYELDIANKQALPWPAGAAAPSALPGPTDPRVNAAWISLPANGGTSQTLNGAGSFAFNKTTLDRASGTAATVTADEANGAAVVLSNILSSPQNFTDSKLAPPQTIDRAADGQPAFSRSTGSEQTIASLVFVSGRRFSPNTTSNGSTTPVNPNGGDGTYLLDANTAAPGGITHDIWTTSTQDTTPPTLIPQGAGNLQYPVVAPQPEAPFRAPRTAEAGLRAGLTPSTAEQNEIRNSATTNNNTYGKRGGLRFAVVLRDTESGFTESTSTASSSSSVRVSLYNANSPRYTNFTPIVNENIQVNIGREDKAALVTMGGQSSFALNVYDDGPVSAGGHEQQADAVAGDGSYYCEGLLPTPPAGDYYIDVATTDRAGNSLRYDNIWGISTQIFTRPNITSDLFVSDYTAGQLFPLILGSDARQANMPPVESYWLTNSAPPVGTLTAAGVTTAGGSATSTAYTFNPANTDVWRTLCRGPVSVDVLNAYRPTIVKQIDPTNPNPTPLPTSTPLPGATATPVPTAGPTATPTATPLPYSQLTRNVAVSQTSIIWAAPYAGTAYVGPGTIVDPTTQANLSSFLNDGGRLFISGRDIAWALSSAGSVSNSFLNNELATTYNGEVNYANGDATVQDAGNGFVNDPINSAYDELQFASRRTRPTADLNQWNDAALNNSGGYDPQNGDSVITYYGPGAYNMDRINPSNPSGSTVLSAYTALGGRVGQRIQVNRTSGIQSRAVFFSFGFESVNRRYRVRTPGDGRIALNIRVRMANNILRYFKTGSVSGTVYNDATNLPVANFLLRITGGGNTFFVRTDANGNYFVNGLPDGGYEVSVYTDNNGLTSPQGFFGGTSRTFGIVGGSPVVTGQDLRIIPTVPGAVIGKAVQSNGTFTNRADDTPIPNLPVLIRSVGESPAFVPTGTGKFARLTTTNATGDFSFASVPARAEMEVIFNPVQADVPAGSNITLTLPKGDPNFGRRIVPDEKRPREPIIVPSGDNFVLNDTGTVTINGTTYTVDTTGNPDTVADERVPVLVPVGPTISGVISLNGTPVSGATVTLIASDSTSRAPITTPATGAYSYVDVRPGDYILRVSLVRGNITFVRDTQIKIVQGEDQTRDVNIVIATLTGRVLQANGQPAANIPVTLQLPNGIAFSPARTATTNAQGNYTIANVPVGGYTYDSTTRTATFSAANGNVTYNVIAAQGALTGTSGNFNVNATATAVTVPTITLSNQQLTGKVLVQYYTVGGNYIVPFAGATVELLDTNQQPLSPRRTTTSASDGSYAFAGVTAGRYYIKATGGGDESLTGGFNATSGAYQAPNVTLVLQRLAGDVIDISGARVPGATVTLTQNGVAIASMVTDSLGAFSFVVAEGENYALTAVKGTSSGSANVGRVVRRVVPKRALITLKFTPTVTPNPTSFTKGKTYAISFPYQTSANATSRNLYDRTRGDATIALTDVFNYAPVGTKAGKTVRFYSVSRFNPNTLAYEAVADTGVLSRGEGYILQVIDTPASGEVLRFTTPAEKSSLKALTEGTGDNTRKFTISLGYSNSLVGNALNGRTLIGFPFNPALYSSVAWDTTSTGTDGANGTSAQIQYGGVNYTVKDAVDRGFINASLIDATTGRSVTAISAYGGYFVTARREGVKLRLQFPTPNN